MHRSRSIVFSLGLAAVLQLAGCRGLEPPYAPGQAPEVDDLMAATAPALESVQVPRAKVRQGGGPAANLMLVAQLPARFAGTIQISGNELVSLAVNEDEYGLRWLAGQGGLEPGYYSGPPSRCAVETLLGVDLEPEEFVELVLGGAPLIPGPHEVGARKWDRKTGREKLTISNGSHTQELEFAWEKGHWQFAGATLWLGDAATWLWTIRHEELHQVKGQTLPAKTEIRTPKPGRGELVIHISFLEQIVNPALGGVSDDPPPEWDEEAPDNAGDTWEEDEDGWETDEEDGEAGESEPKPEPEPKPAPEPKPEVIPIQFVGNPTGLKARGDLCVGR